MLDWMVIGGGPHGVHIAARLVGEVGVPRDQIRIVDDEETLLARWRRCTRNTGMRFLRSPSVHHTDFSSSSLRRFAQTSKARRVEQLFTRPYSRPSLELFDLHSDQVIERLGLEELHVRARAVSLEISDEAVRVGLAEQAGCDAPKIEARHAILALGAPREPEWPEWARLAVESAPSAEAAGAIQHIFDPGFELEENPKDELVAVVGAGSSGAQLAIRCANAGQRVVLVARHALRVHQFDSDPGWQGPKYMMGFSKIRDPNERRRRIREARHRGSVPPDVEAELRHVIEEGLVEYAGDVEVQTARFEEGGVRLQLVDRDVVVNRVLLATGFGGGRPGGELIDQAIEAHDLPCAECGYPIVDRSLRWHPRVFVTGPLAELELGPVSRNLSGAMRAGERIAAVARVP